MTQRPVQQTGMSVHSGLDERDRRYAYWCVLGDISGRTLNTHGFALTAPVVGKNTGLPGEEFLK